MATSLDSNVVKNKFLLNNGTYMPAVGLGTYRIRDSDVVMEVVDQALAAGYRMFDTAAVYRNEAHLNGAFKTLLPKHKLTRDDIFVTTKLSPAEHGKPGNVKRAYANSLKNLGLDYVDLYLIHFPGTSKVPCEDKRNIEFRHATWASMVQLYDDGLVNAIGVSNFTIYHLQLLMERNHGVVPAVNQVEWHPFFYQRELLDYCKANDIVLQAYSSLGGKSVDNNDLLMHSVVTKIAKGLEVSNAQVLLRWALQRDISVIPKSTNPVHIKKNIALNFDIPPEEMHLLDNLEPEQVKYAWDPSSVV